MALGPISRIAKAKNLGWPSFYDPSRQHRRRQNSGGVISFSAALWQTKGSNYNTNRWMLSSGGDKPIEYGINGDFATNPNRVVLKNDESGKKLIEELRMGMTVTGDNKVVLGTIDRVYKPVLTAYLSGTTTAKSGNHSLTFFNPFTDPYTTTDHAISGIRGRNTIRICPNSKTSPPHRLRPP